MLTFIFSFWTRLSKMGLFKPNRSALVSFMIRIFLLGLTIQDTHVTDCFLHKLNSFLLWVRITGLKKPSNYPLITRLSSSFSKLLILLKCPFLVLQTYVQLVYILEVNFYFSVWYALRFGTLNFKNSEKQLNSSSAKRAITQHISFCQSCQNRNLDVSSFKVIRNCHNEYQTKIQKALLIKSEHHD